MCPHIRALSHTFCFAVWSSTGEAGSGLSMPESEISHMFARKIMRYFSILRFCRRGIKICTANFSFSTTCLRASINIEAFPTRGHYPDCDNLPITFVTLYNRCGVIHIPAEQWFCSNNSSLHGSTAAPTKTDVWLGFGVYIRHAGAAATYRTYHDTSERAICVDA